MSIRQRLLRATGGMAAVTVLSRLSGYARDKVIAALLGAGRVGDAFYAGLAVPNMFRAFLAEGSLHAAFIPTLAELKENAQAEDRRQFVLAMTGALLAVLPVIVAGGVIGAPWLVRLFAVGFVDRPDTLALAVKLTRLMFPYLGLISLAALAQGVLNVNDRFLLPAATPIALNLCIVAGVVTATQVAGGQWWWLAVGVLLGGVAQVGLQWPSCKRLGLPLVPGGGGFRHPAVRRVLRLMLPGIPSLGIYQITLLLSYRFASGVGEGAVVWKFNAARLNELVYGILIVQLTTAVLPMLSAERARSAAAARSTLGFAIRVLTLVAFPSAVFLGFMAVPVVGVLFGGGRYGPSDVMATAGALAMYSWGLPFLGLTKLLAGASFAWKDTKLPVVAAAVNLGAFWFLAVSWTPVYGIAGLAAAASAGQAANALTLLVLSGALGRLPTAGDVLPGVGRHLVAAAALGGGLVLVRAQLPRLLTTSAASLAILAGVAAATGATYVLLLVLMRAPEWRDLSRLLAERRQR